MSTKTAIDLSTLGAPDNDSKGLGCYISEKGIQASPAGIEQIENTEGVGKYQGTMYMDGLAYHIFEHRIYDENMAVVEAYYSWFEETGFVYHSSRPKSAIIPDNFFRYILDGEKIDESRPVKTISYMTLTNKRLEFYDVLNIDTIGYEVNNNIVAIFNCNVIAFVDEADKSIRFIKNPVFGTKTQNDITEKFPLGILSIRSWTPVWSNVTSGDTLAEFSDSLRLKEEHRQKWTAGYNVEGNFNVLIAEETVFIYDKNTRKVRAIRQIRRRCKADTIANSNADSPYIINASSSFPTFIMKVENKFIVPNTSGAAPKSHLEYVNYLYVFTDDTKIDYIIAEDPSPYSSRLAAWHKPGWNKSDVDKQTVSSFSTYGTVYLFNRYPEIRYERVFSIKKHKIPYCFHYELNNNEIRALETFQASLGGSITIIDNGNSLFSNMGLGAATPECLWFENGNDIDSVIGDINQALSKDDIATPDNWEKISAEGNFIKPNNILSFLASPWTMVFEFYSSAIIKGLDISIHSQQYLWGQRSRAFSLGTKIFTDINPYEKIDRDNYLEIVKFDDTNKSIGLKTKRIIGGINDIEPIQLAAKTLRLKGRDLNDNGFNPYFFIPALIEWGGIDQTAEYKNAVYFTDIGSFHISVEDQRYEVPSNIADKIIGLWGTDRDILFISTKSIERFNIADSVEVPLTFVRLEKTYDFIIDWSGINKRLDLLIKDKGKIYLNDNKWLSEIFNQNSRIAPDTIWKTVDLRVIENDQNEYIYVIDSQNRAFMQPLDNDTPIFSMTFGKKKPNYLASYSGIWICEWDSDNRFSVAWTYRNERNILLSEITIRMAQLDSAIAEKKREIILYKDNKRINSMKTANSTVKFYKIGRGLSNRLKIETEGYLREVELTDTEGWQK